MGSKSHKRREMLRDKRNSLTPSGGRENRGRVKASIRAEIHTVQGTHSNNQKAIRKNITSGVVSSCKIVLGQE